MPINNEVDLFAFRLMEYWDMVDFFVVTESPQAFSGRPKPLYFGDALCDRFAPFARKLVHVVIDPKLSTGVWEFELAHRVRRERRVGRGGWAHGGAGVAAAVCMHLSLCGARSRLQWTACCATAAGRHGPGGPAAGPAAGRPAAYWGR